MVCVFVLFVFVLCLVYPMLPVLYHTFTSLFVFVLCLVYPMLPVSLDCPFLISPSVFSNVYLSCLSSSCVLCTQCCQFLWIVYSVFSNVYLFCLSSSCVLCTQCCQFLWIVYSVFSNVYFYSPYLISFISAIYLFVLVF